VCVGVPVHSRDLKSQLLRPRVRAWSVRGRVAGRCWP